MIKVTLEDDLYDFYSELYLDASVDIKGLDECSLELSGFEDGSYRFNIKMEDRIIGVLYVSEEI